MIPFYRTESSLWNPRAKRIKKFRADLTKNLKIVVKKYRIPKYFFSYRYF